MRNPFACWFLLCCLGPLSLWSQSPDTAAAHAAYLRAEKAIAAGNLPMAAVALRAAHENYAQAGTWQQAFVASHDLLQCHYYLGEFDQARAVIAESQEFLQAHREAIADSLQGNFHTDCMATYAQDGDLEAARQALDWALVAYGRHSDPAYTRSAQANLYQQAAFQFGSEKAWKQALAFEKANLDLLATFPPDTLYLRRGDSYSDLGYLYLGLDQLDSAWEVFHQARDWYLPETGETHKYIGLVYNQLAFIASRWGDFARQLTYTEKSLRIWQETLQEDEVNLAVAYDQAGQVYEKLGDQELALAYQRKALNICFQAVGPDHSTTGLYHLTLGRSTAMMAQPDSALYHLRRARSIFTAHFPPQHSRVSLVHNALGLFFKSMGQTDSAVWHLEKILAMYEATGDSAAQVGTLINLAGVHKAAGAWEQAHRTLKTALPLAQEVNSPHLSKLLSALGQVAAERGQPALAARYHQQALATMAADPALATRPPAAQPALAQFFPHQDPLRLLLTKGHDLLRAYQQTDSMAYLQASRSTYELAQQVIARMQQRAQSSRQTLTAESLELYEGAMAVYHLLHARTGEAQHQQRLFELAALSQAAHLRKNMQQSRAVVEADLPPALRDQLRDQSTQVGYTEERLHNERLKGPEADAKKVAALEAELFDRREGYRSLQQELAEAYPAYFRLKYDTRAPDLRQVQQKGLQPGELLLQFFWGDSSLYLLALSQEQVYHQFWPWDSVAAASVHALVHHLAEEDLSDAQASFRRFSCLASEVYEHLLAEALAQFPGTDKLVMIPDGALAYLPFELLLTEPVAADAPLSYGRLPYLLRDYQIRYAYAADLLLPQPQQATGPRQAYLGFAPDYAGGGPPLALRSTPDLRALRSLSLRPLRHNLPEVDGAARLLGGKAFLGPAATEAAFKQLAGQHDLLHLAMHAVPNSQDPLYAGLAFAQDSSEGEDGFLFAYEIFNLDLHARLAVLSACQTGVGAEQAGEGIMSLARAFVYAGCPAVLMSLWQADDAATQQIMQDFFARYREDLPPAEALRQARLDYVRTYDQAHPRFWGAFVLVGDPPEAQSAAAWPYWLAIGLGLLLLVGLGRMWVRRGGF
jgi:CHAT domain-containing protein